MSLKALPEEAQKIKTHLKDWADFAFQRVYLVEFHITSGATGGRVPLLSCCGGLQGKPREDTSLGDQQHNWVSQALSPQSRAVVGTGI